MDYRIENQRLYVEGEPVSLFCASFQYWRSDPSVWPRCLEAIRDMGFETVETYMPWSIHERSRGDFDFGARDPALDVARFLDLCSEEGLKVLARPGPHINAELTYFGFPERIFTYEEMLARSADGTIAYLPAPPRMFPIPCYHHPRFTDEVSAYFRALAGEIRCRIHPDGPVVAVQADNECSRFFRTHPFDTDYCAAAIGLYRRFLSEKYGDIDALNETYRSDHRGFSAVDPPRSLEASSPGHVPRYLDWAQFGEYYIRESLRKIAGILRQSLGREIPIFHNYPVTSPSPPFDMAGTEEFLDFQGIDCYPRRTDYPCYSRGIRFTACTSRLPFMAEFSSGGAYFGFPQNLDEQEFTTWSALACGLKGMNFYMIVERERWYGSPVRNDGSLREEHAGLYRRLLREVREWGLEEMRCVRPVRLIACRDYERLACVCSLLSPLPGILFDNVAAGIFSPDALTAEATLGFSEDIPAHYRRLMSFWNDALLASGTHYGISDERSLSDGVRLAIVPTFEFMDAGTQRALLEFARSGGTLVVGPRAPRMSERMTECGILSEWMKDPVETVSGEEVLGLKAGRFSFFEGKSEDSRTAWYAQPVGRGTLVHLGALFDEAPCFQEAASCRPLVDTLLRLSGVAPLLVPEDPRLDIHAWEGGGRMTVFVVNPSPEPVETSISSVPGAFADARTGERFGPQAFSVDLEPYSVRILSGEA